MDACVSDAAAPLFRILYNICMQASSRTVLVTGAASGLGLGIARAFAAQGDQVVACDVSQERLDAAREAIGGDVTCAVVDVRDFAALRTVVQEADAASEAGLHALVNNAGIFDGYASILETSEALWDDVIDINLKGCFHGSKAAAEVMIPRGRGRIVNMASIAAFRGGPDGLSYTASKAGVVGLTQRLAFEVGPHGVTANVVAPGAIATGLRDNSAEILGVSPESMAGGYTRGLGQQTLDWILPARRKGTIEEVASAVVYLASDAAGYVNGTTIHVDGGMIAV
jgi:NAD(P)-dependent dehydrogenase (short-subunit alcohol dehydrogenase family)